MNTRRLQEIQNLRYPAWKVS